MWSGHQRSKGYIAACTRLSVQLILLGPSFPIVSSPGSLIFFKSKNTVYLEESGG